MHFYYDEELVTYGNLTDALASKRKFWFYYYDHVFSKANWKVEPLLSLDELYKIRAQYIRDTYPYVILCYSGGTDSTAMLEAFYYNNIHIDEILVVGALSQDPHKGSDSNHNGDLYHNAFPLLNKLNLPNTKITVFDYTDCFRDGLIKDISVIKQYGNEWIKHVGAWTSVHHIFWSDLKRIVGSDNQKQTAVVFGADKTSVEYSRYNVPYVRFSNLSFDDYGGNYVNDNFNRVNFYAEGHQTSVDIVVKQAHVVHRVTKDCKLHNLQVPDIYKILYRYRNPLNFMSAKSKTTILSVRDMFMLNKQNSEIYTMYSEGLSVLKKYKKLSENFNVYSKSYWLE